VAQANPVDGTRMVAALASRQLGEPVNRKRVQRIMRSHKLLQPSRNTDRRRRPGYFRVTRPDELWHMDMTKVWTAQHGWVYLHVIVDCCTRQITGWRLDLRTRATEAHRLRRARRKCSWHTPRAAHPWHRQRLAVHRPRLPQTPIRSWDHPPPRRLPRPPEPGVHRVLVRPIQEALRLARRVGNPRPGQKGDRRLHRRLPPPTPLRARLPHPRRGRRHLAQRPRDTTNCSDLNRLRQRGPRQRPSRDRAMQQCPHHHPARRTRTTLNSEEPAITQSASV
jgi:hypothetical protein